MRKQKSAAPSLFDRRLGTAMAAILNAENAWERVAKAINVLGVQVRRGEAKAQTTIDLAPARFRRVVELAHAAKALAETVELEIVDLHRDE